MNDFERDDKWQRQLRDKILVPGFYGEYATDGRYVLIDKGRLASHFQKRLAVDTIVQGKGGEVVCIEEKIVRWPKSGKPYTAFCLETESCTKPGHESDGWMVYGKADYLLYCFADETETILDCHLIDFPPLKEWFWKNAETFPPFQMLNTINQTRGRVVPIADIQTAGVKIWSRLIEEPRQAA